jgi:hypothetical protein
MSPDALRAVAPLVGRKCRSSKAAVVALSVGTEGISLHDLKIVYRIGETVTPDKYDPDPRVECSHGIHFFLSRKEAEAY